MSEKIATFATVVSILLLPVVFGFGVHSGGLQLTGKFNLVIRLILILTLFYSMKKHKLLPMQAATVGLLFCMLYAQSQYTLGDLTSRESGYQQFIALYDGKRGGHDSDKFRCYRMLALLDGRACIIDSKTQMHYGEFIGALEKLGVKDALYCDMGSGWNYSWYRNKDGRTVDIIGTPWPFSHNWITFERAR